MKFSRLNEGNSKYRVLGHQSWSYTPSASRFHQPAAKFLSSRSYIRHTRSSKCARLDRKLSAFWWLSASSVFACLVWCSFIRELIYDSAPRWRWSRKIRVSFKTFAFTSRILLGFLVVNSRKRSGPKHGGFWGNTTCLVIAVFRAKINDKRVGYESFWWELDSAYNGEFLKFLAFARERRPHSVRRDFLQQKGKNSPFLKNRKKKFSHHPEYSSTRKPRLLQAGTTPNSSRADDLTVPRLYTASRMVHELKIIIH